MLSLFLSLSSLVTSSLFSIDFLSLSLLLHYWCLLGREEVNKTDKKKKYWSWMGRELKGSLGKRYNGKNNNERKSTLISMWFLKDEQAEFRLVWAETWCRPVAGVVMLPILISMCHSKSTVAPTNPSYCLTLQISSFWICSDPTQSSSSDW